MPTESIVLQATANTMQIWDTLGLVWVCVRACAGMYACLVYLCNAKLSKPPWIRKSKLLEVQISQSTLCLFRKKGRVLFTACRISHRSDQSASRNSSHSPCLLNEGPLQLRQSDLPVAKEAQQQFPVFPRLHVCKARATTEKTLCYSSAVPFLLWDELTFRRCN